MADIKRIQTLTDAEGQPTHAVIPWQEWERLKALLPEAEKTDEQLAQEARDAADFGQGLPLKVIQAMDDAPHPLGPIRKWRRWSQKELADAIGKSEGYIGNIERGTAQAGRTTLIALAKALDVHPDWLVEEC